MIQAHYRDARRVERPHPWAPCFSFSPESAQAAPLVAALQDGSWQAQWPYPLADSLVTGFAAASDEPLPPGLANACLLVPGRLPAPPWGSVWLDKENVLFGDSTLALREWMRARTELVTQRKARSRKIILVRSCCWPPGCANPRRRRRFRSFSPGICCPGPAGSSRCLSPEPKHPFYHSLGQLAQATLAEWQRQLPIAVADKPLYR
ncbi:Twin-arginine leader-binding protein DmsD [Raoultella ornithinolytica]|nr:Twin-arginine leader-binding protein DmsD [Raoultella ornithinolytica]